MMMIRGGIYGITDEINFHLTWAQHAVLVMGPFDTFHGIHPASLSFYPFPWSLIIKSVYVTYTVMACPPPCLLGIK